MLPSPAVPMVMRWRVGSAKAAVLPGPGRRLGEEVAAGEQRRDRLALDRRRLLVAEARDGRQQPRVEVEVGETVGAGVGGSGGVTAVDGRRSVSVVVLRLATSAIVAQSVGSARPDDRLEIDRPDTPGPAGVGPDGGGRDDAGHETFDGGLLAGVEAGAVDPDPTTDA